MYDLVTLLYSRNWHSIINQLYFNKKLKFFNTGLLKGCMGFFSFFFFFFFLLFRALPVAYGGSQARGSNRSYSCRPTPQPQQCRILNPLSKPRDQTHILLDTNLVRYPWATTATPCIFCLFLGPHPWHMEVPRLGGLIGAEATSLHQSHSNARSELHLQPTP